MRNLIITIILFSFLFSCTQKKEGVIDFGSEKSVKASALISCKKYIQLETTSESLVGQIEQIEILDDKIYIMDACKSKSLFVFSRDGKYLNKIEAKGDGPGEFVAPHSFWIDKKGFIYILDIFQTRLLEYSLSDLTYTRTIDIPHKTLPSSFAKLSNGLFVYYFLNNARVGNFEKHFIIADAEGKVINAFRNRDESAKLWHGSPSNFLCFEGKIITYPYFKNKIYTINKDSMHLRYTLAWGDMMMPSDSYFKNKESEVVWEELMKNSSELIRYMRFFENNKNLLVKYYIGKDLYLSSLDKKSKSVSNVKVSHIDLDLGMGEEFPVPLNTYGNSFIGELRMVNLVDAELNATLAEKIKGRSVEDNPILVIYDVKGNE